MNFPQISQSLLEQLSGVTTWVIFLAGGVHLILFAALWVWSGRDLRGILTVLDEFTRGMRHRSVLDRHSHYSDQIDAFIADVNDVISDVNRTDDREACYQRMSILDERRSYLDSMSFATSYNICRTMIEAYPLAGVLGTILAIGAALHGAGEAEVASASTTLSAIVARFGDAIWSTFAGLSVAILLMFVNSIMEPRFYRLGANREQVRDLIAQAKRELAWQRDEPGSARDVDPQAGDNRPGAEE